jgi:glycosyltransferase-like protein
MMELPLSVGILTYSTRPRGSVVCAAGLAEALTRLGVRAVLYAIDKGEGGFYRALDCPLELILGAEAPEGEEALLRQRMSEVSSHLEKLTRRHDVLHAMDCLGAGGIHQARARGSVWPWIQTMHHLDEGESPFIRACRVRSARAADALVCVSRETAERVERELGHRPRVIHNGVNSHRFKATRPSRLGEVRHKFGLRDSPYVLSVGGIEPRKNPLLALEGFARFRTRHPEFRWVIAGGASFWNHRDYRQAFADKVADMDLGAVVHVTGEVAEDDLTDLYQGAHLFLHTAEQEGWGLCILEAGLAGVALVVPAGAPYDEYLAPGEATFCEVRSAESLAAALEVALQRPEFSRSLVRRRLMRFDWEKSAKEYLEVYRRVISDFHAGAKNAALESVC